MTYRSLRRWRTLITGISHTYRISNIWRLVTSKASLIGLFLEWGISTRHSLIWKRIEGSVCKIRLYNKTQQSLPSIPGSIGHPSRLPCSCRSRWSWHVVHWPAGRYVRPGHDGQSSLTPGIAYRERLDASVLLLLSSAVCTDYQPATSKQR